MKKCKVCYSILHYRKWSYNATGRPYSLHWCTSSGCSLCGVTLGSKKALEEFDKHLEKQQERRVKAACGKGER